MQKDFCRALLQYLEHTGTTYDGDINTNQAPHNLRVVVRQNAEGRERYLLQQLLQQLDDAGTTYDGDR